MIEVERKFRVSDRKAVEQVLQEQYGADPIVTHQIDTVFLVGDGGFKSFTPGDPVMRIRQTGDKTELTFKRAINDAGDRLEYELTLDNAYTAELLLRELGHQPVTAVDKVRNEYKQQDYTVVLDEVKNLGTFVEIEIICQEGQEKEAGHEIDRIADRLGLRAADIETQKYDQLLAQG